MENRALEIQECRREIRELRSRLDALTARVNAMERTEEVVPAYAVSPVPVQASPRPRPEAKAATKKTPGANLENAVGRNLFAVLASLLVLIGVGVFISTIYEYIPQFVKLLAIYLFGFGLLAAGLALYRKNSNKFWLGVASCGLAELLVSIITSHSYFAVLSLPATFGLVLVWILGSFWLTRFQPTVFKTIGFVGFLISMILGLDLLTGRDTVIYLTLLAAYVVLSVFFMVTNRRFVTMNTLMAFGSVVGLCLFMALPGYLPEGWEQTAAVAALGILGLFHAVYVLRAKLSRNAYPLYAMATVMVLLVFVRNWEPEWIIPLLLGVILALWYVGHRMGAHQGCRVFFAMFAAVFPLAMSVMGHGWGFYGWYPVCALVACVLYWMTGSREIGWIGLVWVLAFWKFAAEQVLGIQLLVMGAAAGAFGAIRSGHLRKDGYLETAWYVLLFVMAHSILDHLPISRGNWMEWETASGLFFALLTVVNTGYLHLVTRDRERIMHVTIPGVAVMVLQGYLFIHDMDGVDSNLWFVSLLGVVSSLLILAHSLWYTYKTRGSHRGLMVWQFVKFSVYCAVVLIMLDSPSILVNISLLVIAILAIGVGFRLGHKSVRIYGLVLSLLDVVSLVLFNIDYSDSLQLAGGIILCGGLCFVISFIYSRISRLRRQDDA